MLEPLLAREEKNICIIVDHLSMSKNLAEK
jgi:hypothetical protein